MEMKWLLRLFRITPKVNTSLIGVSSEEYFSVKKESFLHKALSKWYTIPITISLILIVVSIAIPKTNNYTEKHLFKCRVIERVIQPGRPGRFIVSVELPDGRVTSINVTPSTYSQAEYIKTMNFSLSQRDLDRESDENAGFERDPMSWKVFLIGVAVLIILFSCVFRLFP